MIIKKDATAILNNGLDLLTENTPIKNIYPGAIARTIIESFAHELGSNPDTTNFYDIAESILRNGYLSLAKDNYLELIGELLSCPRREAESFDATTGLYVTNPIDDDTYRYEISRQVHVVATSNEEAIRMALLSINGVQNVVGEEYTLGTGSFTFLVIPLGGYSNVHVEEEAEAVIKKVKAYGIRYEVVMPTEILLDIRIQAVLKESTAATDRTNALTNAQSHLTNYMNEYELAESFIYNDFVQEVMNSDENIMDFKVLSFYMDSEPVLLMNQSVNADERIRPGSIEVV